MANAPPVKKPEQTDLEAHMSSDAPDTSSRSNKVEITEYSTRKHVRTCHIDLGADFAKLVRLPRKARAAALNCIGIGMIYFAAAANATLQQPWKPSSALLPTKSPDDAVHASCLLQETQHDVLNVDSMTDTVYLPLAHPNAEDVAASSTASLPGPSFMATSATLTSSSAIQIATYVASTLTTSLTSSTASSVMAANATGNFKTTGEDAGAEKDECKLLGPFAVLVQGALGLLALLSLVYKRWRERPQRPVKIWAFDASKQVVGSALLHLANLGMSQFSSGQLEAARAHAAAIAEAASKAVATGDKNKFGHNPNPCSFYLLNLAIDTTIGIPILIFIIRLYTVGAALIVKPPESIQSGNYGQPAKWTWWLKQSVLYFFGLLSMKACVFVIFELCPWIIVVGNWALRWTDGNEAIQIAFVMLIFPLIMNALQYYIIDSFIKKKAPAEDGAEEREHEEGEEDGLLTPDSDTLVAEEGDIDQARKEAKVSVKSKGSERKSYGVGTEDEPPGTPQTGESSESPSSTGEQSPARKTT